MDKIQRGGGFFRYKVKGFFKKKKNVKHNHVT